MFKNLLCKIGIHNWKIIFHGCPAYYNGFVEGKSCKNCGKLQRVYDDLFASRPKTIPMDLHFIVNKIPTSQMTNKELQFYLRNLNNVDKK